GGGSDDRRRQQRWCEEADGEADASSHLEAPAAEVVAGLGHVDLAVGVLLDQHDALDRDRLVLGQLHHRVEVLLGEVLDEVRGDQHVLRVVTHCASPSYAVIACAVCAHCACSARSRSLASVRCGLTSKTTFLTVPVNANGDLSA